MIVFPSWKQDLDSYLNQALTNRLFQLECEENKNNEIIKFTNLQISHSSEVIAYISNENEVKVFSLQEKNLVWSLSPRKKNEKFTCLQFNPKSNNIYVASNVYGIKQYDISTGGIIDEYPVDEGKYCVSFQCSKTGQYLIAALDNGSLVAYHAKKPENLLLLDSGHSHVNSLAITGQEQVILTVSTQELKIWTFPSFKQMFEPTTLEDCTEGVTIKVSDSEKYLLLNCGDHSMNIYNLETLELLYRIEDEERLRIVDFSLTHDDQILIMLASDSSVIFHDFHANQEITRLKTLKYNDPMGLVVSPDLKFFAVASSKGSLIGYELLSSIDVVEEHNVCQNRTVIGICLTHNQKYLIAAEENGTITIYDTNKQRMLACYENKVQERIRSLALSADDKYLVIGGENKMFIVFRLDASGQNVQLIKEYESQKLPDVIVKLAVIAANGFVVAELKSGDIQAFQLATKEIIMINNSRLNSSHHNYGRIKAMKQGPGLIFGNDKGHIKIINLLTRKMTHEFRNLVSTPISAIGVSSTLIAVGASDPMIALIRLDHRTVEHILTHQEIATFRSLNFSSDESYLVAATASLVTIYETGRGRQLYSFKVDTEILEAKFFQGTTHIITSHFDGVAKVHKIPFLNEISVIDLSLKVPYGTMSKIPGYKLRRMWNNEIDITPQVIQSFAKSYTLPFKINFWYYYFLTQQSMQEPSVITNWIIDADIPVLTDMDKLNIIYYLVKSNEITSLNTVFRRAEEALDDSPPSVFTSLSDVMDDIIASKVPQLANFLEVCVGQPEVSEQKLLKLGDTDGMPLYVFSNERKLTTKILNTLVKDGADPLVFYTSKVQLDPNFFSPKNLKIFEAVFRNENLEIYRSKLVRKLIDAAWLKARPSLWAKAILDVGFLVLLSIYASSKVDSTPDPWVVNFMYGYNSLLLTYEICQFIGNSKLYIRSVLNLLDLVRIALIYATLINSNASVDDYSNGDASSANDGATSPKVAGVVIFAIFFNYLKLITHFRLLKPARKLIRMVVETITDMITFTLFFGLITFGLAFMIYLSGILFTNRTAISLGNAIGNVYSIALGQFDVDGYDALDWGLFVLSTFLLAIVLLPLLISIINNTFTEGRKNAIPNEYIEKLDLILESAATQKGLKRLLLLVRKERPPPKVVGSMVGSRDLGSSRDLSSSRDLRSGHPKKYLFWVDEVHAEGENEKEATWETGIRDVRKDVELNVKKHNADIIKKIGLIAKALGTLTETKKEAWKLYCKEQKLSEKAMSDYIIAKRDLHILKRKLDMADEESFEDNDISSELSLEDDGRHFVSEERFISRPKKSGRKTIF